MLQTIILAVISLMTQMLPMINSSSQVAKFIAMLIQILPTVEQLAADLVQPIKNIINALSANPATDAAQLKSLQDLDVQFDTAFEAAATAAQAEDAATKP
jgi:hypothetical protein